jgi:hypothetical protein
MVFNSSVVRTSVVVELVKTTGINTKVLTTELVKTTGINTNVLTTGLVKKNPKTNTELLTTELVQPSWTNTFSSVVRTSVLVPVLFY